MGRTYQRLYFTAPGQVEVRQEALSEPGPGELAVQTLRSAVSAGSELLIYRGQFPTELPLDDTIPALQGAFCFPLAYGYAAVGEVISLGSGVDTAWLGRQVFSFQPHTSHFIASLEAVQLIPSGIPPETAISLANMETALNLVMDGAPRIGEHVAVFGQGVVGLLTTALLARFPLASLVTLDHHALRREASRQAGAHESLDSAAPALEALRSLQPGGADLVFELSGAPEALDQAIAAAGFAATVVIGSWYGQKRVPLELGGRFHRSRIRLVSSQVSSIAPELSGRWTKERRFAAAWEFLPQVQPQRWITHRFPIHQAAEAYRLLDQNPSACIQVVFTYD